MYWVCINNLTATHWNADTNPRQPSWLQSIEMHFLHHPAMEEMIATRTNPSSQYALLRANTRLSFHIHSVLAALIGFWKQLDVIWNQCTRWQCTRNECGECWNAHESVTSEHDGAHEYASDCAHAVDKYQFYVLSSQHSRVIETI